MFRCTLNILLATVVFTRGSFISSLVVSYNQRLSANHKHANQLATRFGSPTESVPAPVDEYNKRTITAVLARGEPLSQPALTLLNSCNEVDFREMFREARIMIAHQTKASARGRIEDCEGLILHRINIISGEVDRYNNLYSVNLGAHQRYEGLLQLLGPGTDSHPSILTNVQVQTALRLVDPRNTEEPDLMMLKLNEYLDSVSMNQRSNMISEVAVQFRDKYAEDLANMDKELRTLDNDVEHERFMATERIKELKAEIRSLLDFIVVIDKALTPKA